MKENIEIFNLQAVVVFMSRDIDKNGSVPFV